MSARVWSANGYGSHFLNVPGRGVAVVTDHWTHAEALVRMDGVEHRNEFGTVAAAKTWSENRVEQLGALA